MCHPAKCTNIGVDRQVNLPYISATMLAHLCRRVLPRSHRSCTCPCLPSDRARTQGPRSCKSSSHHYTGAPRSRGPGHTCHTHSLHQHATLSGSVTASLAWTYTCHFNPPTCQLRCCAAQLPNDLQYIICVRSHLGVLMPTGQTSSVVDRYK
jgi:hypothetical protein